MKHLFPLLFLPLLVACSTREEPPAEAVKEVDLANEIRQCSRIYASEYQVSKIVVQRDQRRIKGHLLGIDVDMATPGGERVIAVPIEGVLKAYVDMAELTDENVHRFGDTIEIVLPDPKIMLTSTRIRSDEIQKQVGLLQSEFTDEELTALQRQGRDSLIAVIPRLGLIENSRESAARRLIALLSSLGFEEENIRITFASDIESMKMPRKVREMMVEEAK